MKFYYFNSTHWDREWYQPFQHYRKYLLDTTEGLLHVLENNPEFEKFTFDGQTIVLDDIVEIRPDWRDKLKRQIAAGRLNVGPWYVMPDEFLVSGEALIRNLLVGHELAEEFGANAWPVGYLCDMFGHIAQMPQLLRGFDISTAVAWRGFDRKLPPFLRWQALDGSVCNLIKLSPRDGYAAFSLHCSSWWDLPHDSENFKTNFKRYVESTREYFGETFILSDGLDHAHVHSQAPDFLRWIKEAYPEAEVVHTDYRNLPEFNETESLPIICGEQIHTCDDLSKSNNWQIPYTLSSRYDLKAANDRLQNALELNWEPTAAYQSMSGSGNNYHLLKFAWKTLLKNQAHDSICGCSIDAVHRVMLTRFDEVAQIGDMLVEDLVLQDRREITGKAIFTEAKRYVSDDLSGLERSDDGTYTLRMFNPLPYPCHNVLSVEIAFPIGYPATWQEPFGTEKINAFRLYDENGDELVYGIMDIKRNQVRRFYRHDARKYDIYTITVKPRLRPSSWISLSIRPSETPVRCFSSLLTGLRQAENSLVKLRINLDGTFDLTDKISRRVYQGLNDFIIDREIGDGWGHVAPVGNKAVIGVTDSCSVAVIEDSPLRTSFEITRCCHLPRELDFNGTVDGAYAGIVPSENIDELKIITSVSLETGSSLVKVKTILDNRIKDYRLRLVVPTGITGKYFTGQSFVCLERSPGRESGCSSENYAEAEPMEKNFNGITGKRDAQGGIAFLSQYGLHEISGSKYDSGDLFVTLLRAFQRTVATNGENDGQLPGQLKYEYAYSLFDGRTGYAGLYRQWLQLRMNIPSYLIKTERITGKHNQSILELSGELSFAAFKPCHADDGNGDMILRLVNLTGKETQGTVGLSTPVREISRCGLNEKEECVLAENVTELDVKASPWQIVTLKIKVR